MSFPGFVPKVFFLPSKRCLAVILASLSDGVGQFAYVSPPRSNQNVANLCPLLWSERGSAINWALECAVHYSRFRLKVTCRGIGDTQVVRCRLNVIKK